MPDLNNTAPNTGKVVPEADLLRVKGSLENKLKVSNSRIADLESQLAALKRDREDVDFDSEVGKLGEPEKLVSLRKSIVHERLALDTDRKKFESERAELESTKLENAKKAFAEKYGVDLTVMDDADSVQTAELAALRAVTSGAKKDAPPQPTRAETPKKKVDLGGSASPGTQDLSPEQKVMLGLQARGIKVKDGKIG